MFVDDIVALFDEIKALIFSKPPGHDSSLSFSRNKFTAAQGEEKQQRSEERFQRVIYFPR